MFYRKLCNKKLNSEQVKLIQFYKKQTLVLLVELCKTLRK